MQTCTKPREKRAGVEFVEVCWVPQWQLYASTHFACNSSGRHCPRSLFGLTVGQVGASCPPIFADDLFRQAIFKYSPGRRHRGSDGYTQACRKHFRMGVGDKKKWSHFHYKRGCLFPMVIYRKYGHISRWKRNPLYYIFFKKLLYLVWRVPFSSSATSLKNFVFIFSPWRGCETF